VNTPPPSTRPARVLLINPRFPESFWSFKWALNLKVEALAQSQREQLAAFLAHFSHCGGKFSLRLDATLQQVLALDSSVFHLVLEDA
jgi:hypothetical protein